MTKKMMSLFLALFFCLCMPLCISATEKEELLIDEADILTDSEESALRTKLADISKNYNAQVSIVTLSSMQDGDIDEFVKFLFDVGGYGYGDNHDGVMLLICMDIREFRIFSNGFAAKAITLDDIDSISDAMNSSLSDGDYADAFDVYAEKCDYYLNGYINGFPFEAGKNLLIAVVIGIVVAWIVTSVLKGQLKSVRKQYRANDYVKNGSMQITQSHDFFLYSTVTSTPRQDNRSSGSRSGSGSSRNVGGGKF